MELKFLFGIHPVGDPRRPDGWGQRPCQSWTSAAGFHIYRAGEGVVFK